MDTVIEQKLAVNRESQRTKAPTGSVGSSRDGYRYIGKPDPEGELDFGLEIHELRGELYRFRAELMMASGKAANYFALQGEALVLASCARHLSDVLKEIGEID